MDLFKQWWERSGWKVILTMVLTWLVASIPQWTEAIVLPEPWDRIVTDVLTLVAGIVRLVVIQLKGDPSVPASRLPESVVETLSEGDRARIHEK